MGASKPEVELEVGDPAESELELGLGLSLGGGAGAGAGGGSGKSSKLSGSLWGECSRILTAKDFPSVGSKRAANSVSQDGSGASPPRSCQVVGWPPVGSHRMNSLVNNQATKAARAEGGEDKREDKRIDSAKKINGKERLGFVKVNKDGAAIGRKVDLNAHSSYENLAQTLESMFFGSKSSIAPVGSCLEKEKAKSLKLLDGSTDFVLTYEDNDGDWMLVGDVPWRMFVGSVRRLRIMRTSEANGLAPRCQETNDR